MILFLVWFNLGPVSTTLCYFFNLMIAMNPLVFISKKKQMNNPKVVISTTFAPSWQSLLSRKGPMVGFQFHQVDVTIPEGTAARPIPGARHRGRGRCCRQHNINQLPEMLNLYVPIIYNFGIFLDVFLLFHWTKWWKPQHFQYIFCSFVLEKVTWRCHSNHLMRITPARPQISRLGALS